VSSSMSSGNGMCKKKLINAFIRRILFASSLRRLSSSSTMSIFG
jgi:hypothetical protein